MQITKYILIFEFFSRHSLLYYKYICIIKFIYFEKVTKFKQNKKRVWTKQDIIDSPCCMYDGLPGSQCNKKFRPPTSISPNHKSV